MENPIFSSFITWVCRETCNVFSTNSVNSPIRGGLRPIFGRGGGGVQGPFRGGWDLFLGSPRPVWGGGLRPVLGGPRLVLGGLRHYNSHLHCRMSWADWPAKLWRIFPFSWLSDAHAKCRPLLRRYKKSSLNIEVKVVENEGNLCFLFVIPLSIWIVYARHIDG